MPDRTEHCNHTKMRYGVTGESVHRWMDEPVNLVGPNHRMYRHDAKQKIPYFLIEEYGENLARNIMLDHIMLDKEATVSRIYKNEDFPRQTTISEEDPLRTPAEWWRQLEAIMRPKEEARKEEMRGVFQHYLDAGCTKEAAMAELEIAGYLNKGCEVVTKESYPEKKVLTWAEILVRIQALDVRLKKLEVESGVFRGPELLQ